MPATRGNDQPPCDRKQRRREHASEVERHGRESGDEYSAESDRENVDTEGSHHRLLHRRHDLLRLALGVEFVKSLLDRLAQAREELLPIVAELGVASGGERAGRTKSSGV